MIRPVFRALMVATALTMMAASAGAQQQPLNLIPPQSPPDSSPGLNLPAQNEAPAIPEEAPNFQPLRQVEPEAEPAPAAAPAPVSAVPAAAAPQSPPPLAVAAVPAALLAPAEQGMSVWMASLLLLAGAFLAGLFGIFGSAQMRRADRDARRRSVAATLAIELETRRLAVETVPLPPNVEAGVSFVSSVISLANIEAGFRSAQADLHLLPEKLAAHVCVHYAAVQRVADFVKGQSLAASVRMLQANRLGGHPCPDAGAMREAHVELAAAFRGVEKLISTLRGMS